MSVDSDTLTLVNCADAERRKRVLGELFRGYRKRLEAMVHLRLDPRVRQRMATSDVLQQSFLEASRRIDDFLREPQVSVFVWLRFLTAQEVLAAHRRHLGAKARDARKEIHLGAGAVPAATSEALAASLLGREESPSEQVVRAEERTLLAELLEMLDPLDREILAMRHFEDLTNEEAAQELGIAAPTAKKRYFRALTRLKHILKQVDGGPFRLRGEEPR